MKKTAAVATASGTAMLIILVAAIALGSHHRTELQVQRQAPAGSYAKWLAQDSRPMRPSGVQPGSGKSDAYVGKDGLTTNSIEGDGFIDKGWKSMWQASQEWEGDNRGQLSPIGAQRPQ